MTYLELCDEVGAKTLATASQVEAILNATAILITKKLRLAENVHFKNLGTFVAKRRTARMVKNPRTGVFMQTPELMTPKFRPSSFIKREINNL